MELQSIIVGLLVAGSFVYAAWSLSPQAARRLLAQALLRCPLPPSLAKFLRQAAQAPAGCNCSGCDRAPAHIKKTEQRSAADACTAQPLVFHPRKQFKEK
ncbi:MAG: hypothetical protein KJ614_17690 [Gammaproteobacteria bacterium]|uniref:hypothetical protein n=1 Tax=Rhodoferax sp. TaxID=50421 RepID=UPI00182122F3|nr:hypothetical protein [Rhodoferax sp.]MBU3900721.1 hypothetical protein [Gammaproteobacteria bacterium]MBA3056734.1 hypothetical protein [Rhodoferax sp.]MBU3997201.1 hypothetical protein [Gammaproteobacteria bacterium]MBU4079472.1 hypothetical protein [Gammaproteobacteria bacterium]MBU4114820.1 hypothetical protein [Gammaproteobacteria bacterium]